MAKGKGSDDHKGNVPVPTGRGGHNEPAPGDFSKMSKRTPGKGDQAGVRQDSGIRRDESIDPEVDAMLSAAGR